MPNLTKENILKVLTQERKAFFQTSGRGSLPNLTKVRIRIKVNGSMKMNMEKGCIVMNVMMMTSVE